VRGINPDALAELPVFQYADSKTTGIEEDLADGLSKTAVNVNHEDLARVRRIQKLMDYQLEEMDGVHQTPSGAIKIAELLGVDEALLREMRAARQEE
jgi:hypothetical protein